MTFIVHQLRLEDKHKIERGFYYMMSDDVIALAIGQRFKKLRLRKNLTQEELASRAILSISTVKSLETGKGKLKSMIAILRELGSLDDLDPGRNKMILGFLNHLNLPNLFVSIWPNIR